MRLNQLMPGRQGKISAAADKVLTHRIFAVPIFLGIMCLVFGLTFGFPGAWLSGRLSSAIGKAVSLLSCLLLDAGVNPAFHSLVIDGICAGVGSVLSFLPTIAVLFFLLSFLEDCGYMPRIALILDRPMRRLGLSGRSAASLLIGFGCSVPAILSVRSLPEKKDRRLTAMLIPFMSCSAKLPIYTVFAASFFGSFRISAIAAVYLFGILLAAGLGSLFSKTLFRGEPAPLAPVLPPYRIPAAKNLLLPVWENVRGFAKKAFTVIFAAAIVIWFLQNFDTGFSMTENSEESILAAVGKAAAPFLRPLGFGDWRAAAALISGLSAKEAVIGTLAVLSKTGGGSSQAAMLTEIFSPLSAFSFLIFCLLYMPCIASLAALGREMGGRRYAAFAAVFQCALAWLTSFVIFQTGSLFAALF